MVSSIGEVRFAKWERLLQMKFVFRSEKNKLDLDREMENTNRKISNLGKSARNRQRCNGHDTNQASLNLFRQYAEQDHRSRI